jgi:hypothetical protein
MAVVELPPGHVMALLEEAYFTDPAGSHRDYAASRQALLRVCPAALEPLDPELARGRSVSLIGVRSEQLLEHPFVNAWNLEEAVLVRAEAAIGNLDASPLVLSEHQSAGRQELALAKVLQEAPGAAFLARLRRRLEETTHLLLARGEADLAAEAARVALELTQDEPASSPFLVALLKRSLERRKQATKSDSGLILPP